MLKQRQIISNSVKVNDGLVHVFNGDRSTFFFGHITGAHESSLLSCRFVPSIWTVFDKHKCTFKTLNN